jgi:hypothetical protein
MKRLLVQLSLITLSAAALYAGAETYSSKNTAAAQPSPNWYGEHEWNSGLWGTYAFTSNDYPTLQNSAPTFGAPNHDTYIEADHAWGGGVEGKYFFARYFGIGVEGYALDVQQSFPDVHVSEVLSSHNFVRTSHDRKAIGSILGTFTLRYPLGCSRFAPYVFAGGGAIFGGGQRSTFLMLVDEDITSRSDARTKAAYRNHQRLHLERHRWKRQQLRYGPHRHQLCVLASRGPDQAMKPTPNAFAWRGV